MDEFERQVLQIQADINAEDALDIAHQGENAEQAYSTRMASLSLTEGQTLDGRDVVKALLVRCILWIEIIREKYVLLNVHLRDCTDSCIIDKARSTSDFKNNMTSCSRYAIHSNK